MRKLFHTDDAWTGFILRMTVGGWSCSPWRAEDAQVGSVALDSTARWDFYAKDGPPLDRRVSGHHREFFGSLGLLAAGLLTRVTAASFIVIMLGAISDCACAGRFFHELVWAATRVKATNIICS